MLGQYYTYVCSDWSYACSELLNTRCRPTRTHTVIPIFTTHCLIDANCLCAQFYVCKFVYKNKMSKLVQKSGNRMPRRTP